MLQQLEAAIVAIQVIALASIFLCCMIVSIGTALVCAIITRSTITCDRVRVAVSGPISQDGQSTGRLESPGQAQG
jgi:hypothetical protein